MSGLVQSTDEALRQWRVGVAPLEGAARLTQCSQLLQRIEISNSQESQLCIATELVRAGVASDLLCLAEQLTADLRGQALECMLRLLQQNEAACVIFGCCPEFEKLLLFVTAALHLVADRKDPGLHMIAGFHCMNTILAVCSEARGIACQKNELLNVLGDLLESSSASSAFADLALATLSHLVMPELSNGSDQLCADAKNFLKDGRCAVCLDDNYSGEALQCLWRCHTCGHAMHRQCAEQWLARWRRCPYCRAFRNDKLPNMEARNMLSPKQLLNNLSSERAAHDVPHFFSVATFLMNLLCKDEASVTLETLGQYGFFSQLSEAAQAALEKSDWPKGSNCFPLIWKVAITIAQVARGGYAPMVVDALRSVVRFLLQGKGGESERVWCIRAVVACLQDVDIRASVDLMLDEESGGDYEHACILYELRETLARSVPCH